MENKVIQKVIDMIPLMKNAIGIDFAVSLLAYGELIYFSPAESFKMDTKVGDRIYDVAVAEVFKTGNIREYTIPEEAFGEPIYGKYVPIFEEGGDKVTAVIACSFSVKRAQMIEQSSASLNSSLEETESTVEDFAKDIQNLAAGLGEIQQVSQSVEQKVNEVASLIATIKGNAQRSNILALNASIEAARAGEAGRGFTVVAREMGKLAQASGEMSAKISSTLTELFKNLGFITNSVQKSNEVAVSQAASIEEITATLDSISSESGLLASMAKER